MFVRCSMIEGAFGDRAFGGEGHEFVTLVLLLTYCRHKQEYARMRKCQGQEIFNGGKLYLRIFFQRHLLPLRVNDYAVSKLSEENCLRSHIPELDILCGHDLVDDLQNNIHLLLALSMSIG